MSSLSQLQVHVASYKQQEAVVLQMWFQEGKQHQLRFFQSNITNNSNHKDNQLHVTDDLGVCYPDSVYTNFPWERISCDPTPSYTWKNMSVESGNRFHNKASLGVFQTTITKAEVNVLYVSLSCGSL